MKLKEKILTGAFWLILAISGIIRFFQVSNYNTVFTFDQSRDLLDIRVLGTFRDLTVFGPTTSINGLRLGPFYYYLNLPAYWLGHGDPLALVYWNILCFLVAGVAIFWFFRKRNIVLGFLASIFFLMAPQLFNITRYFWNANTAAYLSVFYFLSLWNFLEKKDKKSILILGVSSGMLTQFEAAFGIVCLVFSVIAILLNKRFKKGGYFLLGMIPWFLPQMALEVKNKFQMTKLFLGIFNGQNQVLGDKLSLIQSAGLHLKSIIYFFDGQMILPYRWGIYLLILAIVVILINKKQRKIGASFIGFVFFAYIFYVLIYHHELKGWYLESLRVWYCLVVAMALTSFKKYKKLLGTLLVVFFVGNLVLTISDQWKFIGNKLNDDPKNLKNLLSNIDWVYQKTNGVGFRAYNYVPEVYDYPNQYLYWWYGNKKYGYMPEKVSYSLTEVPEYFRMSNEFYQGAKTSDGKTIALIYETKASYIGWLNQFKEYCTVDKMETGWRTTLEIRQKCKN